MAPLAGRWHAVAPEKPARALGLRRAVGGAAMLSGGTVVRRSLAAAARFPATRPPARLVSKLALDAFFEAVAVPAAQQVADVATQAQGSGTTPVSGARIINGLTPCNAIADEILTDHPNRLRALWIESSNPAHSLADSRRFVEAMAEVDLSVVIDVAFTETARQADYVLPAASQFEKLEASLFTLHFPHNVFQLRRPLMAPLPGTRSEPEMYAELIDRLGVVKQRVIDDLVAAARISRGAFALAFFSTIARDPSLAGLTPYLLYRTLGATLPPKDRAAAMVWSFAQLCAISQPDAVRRAGFTGSGFALGESLFEAILDHREGVTFTDDRYEDAWKYIQHADGKMALHS